MNQIGSKINIILGAIALLSTAVSALTWTWLLTYDIRDKLKRVDELIALHDAGSLVNTEPPDLSNFMAYGDEVVMRAGKNAMALRVWQNFGKGGSMAAGVESDPISHQYWVFNRQ